MFFYLSKIFSTLLFPLPLLIIITWVTLFLLRKKIDRLMIPMIVSFAIIHALATPFISSMLMASLENQIAIAPPLADLSNRSSNKNVADVIVVLAGMVDIEVDRSPIDIEFGFSVDRILCATDLYKKKVAPVILISGGSGLMNQSGKKEALLLKEWLFGDLEGSIKEENIFAEADSKNSGENSLESAKIIRSHPEWKKIILITSAFHMPRAYSSFKRAMRESNVEMLAYPCDYKTSRAKRIHFESFFPSADALAVSTLAVKEWIGILVYRLYGYM